MSKRKKPSEVIKESVERSNDVELSNAKTEASKWRRKYADAARTASENQSKLDAVLGLPDDVNIQDFGRSEKTKPGDVAVVIPANDWHVEERVTPETVNGKNKFNLTIAERRVKTLYQQSLEMIDDTNRRSNVTEIWHPLLGDLITGHIHEELVETNFLSPTEACVFVQDMVCSGIDLWLKETKLPIFIPTCCGNHGRTTPRKRIKTSCENSFEWLIYMTMAKFYANNTRVNWKVGKGHHNIQTIMGRKIRFHHGDGLRYNGGVGGITIPVNKAISKWQKITSCDLDIFGHWHQYLYHYPSWISCGCLIGYSEYALEVCKAEFQHPTQTFIVIDRGLCVRSCVPIYLEKPKRGRR